MKGSRILLGFMLCLVVISVAVTGMGWIEFGKMFRDHSGLGNMEKDGGKEVRETGGKGRMVWEVGGHELFSPDVLVYEPEKKKVVKLDLDEEMKDGISARWKQKYHFSLEDAKMALEDTDGDGFSNVEEYRAGTNPRDRKSVPELAMKLRLAACEFVPYDFIFKGYSRGTDGVYIFQINLDGGKTCLLKEGDAVPGRPWVVKGFRRETETAFHPATKMDMKEDRSKIVLSHQVETGKMLVLNLNEKARSDRSLVRFISLSKEQPDPAKLLVGERFEFGGAWYSVLKVDGKGAEIGRVEDGKRFSIPKAK